MRVSTSLLAAFICALGLTASAARDTFPNPASGIREDTPDDPSFDCHEPDDEDDADCGLFSEQVHLFGFAPADTALTATYKDAGHLGAGQVGQISGMSADLAWKTTIGRPDITIAILDTGIRWNNGAMRKRIWLNCAELPAPEGAPAGTWTGCKEPDKEYDLNGDGAFDVDDYALDTRVDPAGGPNGTALVDAQDVIGAFDDGVDDGGNGYVDDIAGWDFFENDNDPADLTSYSAAAGHGTGRASDAAEEGNDGSGEIGVCPRCRIMPLRIWDTFVPPGDTWAAATVYAADNGAKVTENAIGMLQNTRASLAANRYAFEKGLALMQVSSDLNTASHNWPTNYVESTFVNGCVADTATATSTEFIDGAAFAEQVTTWFRNSGLTQYGAHAHICHNAVTGSQATGQASGAAGMVFSIGLDEGLALTSNEVKQLLTMNAEDVLPENTTGTGTPDPAFVGWDEHFGYGRTHLAASVQAVADGKIPPEALIQDPPWWYLLDPGTANTGKTVPVRGLARAARSSACTYTLQWAVGIQPAEGDFTNVVTNAACPGTANATLGNLPIDAIADAIGAHARDGSVPVAGPNPGETRPYSDTRADPNAHMFTVRLIVEDGATPKNRGEDRKVYVALHDPTWHAGWPKFVDVGGESSPVLYDLDGDGTLEILEGDSGGALCAWRHDGTKLPSFNGGQCWQLSLSPMFTGHAAAPGFATAAVPVPTGGLRTPAVADLDGDFDPDIVLATGDGRLYVLRSDGSTRLTLGVDPAKSTPDKRDAINHPKRGILGSAVVADLDADGIKEIVVAALDGFLYVWDGKTGAPKAGFPREVSAPLGPNEEGTLKARGELIQTPAIADLVAGGATRQIVTSSSDMIATDATPPCDSPTPDCAPPVLGGSSAIVAWTLAHALGGDTRVYAFNHDGTPVAGWPVSMSGILPDVLPFVGPQHAVAVGDVDGDGDDETVASMTTGEVTLIEGDGSSSTFTSDGVVNGGSSSETSRIINLFENAVLGDLNGIGGLDVAKVGITADELANLIADGQNFPFNHVVQAWDSAAPENYLPGYPTAIDDYGLLSSPAIANVDGAGGPEILVGSGLYLLHAYDPMTGTDVDGFPKQTGGWLFSVPAVGDLDGDGDLEVVAGTREGWRFVWDTGVAATTAANSEWWTESHDECHTNNYATDCRPPNRVKNLAYSTATSALTFDAPGDDWNAGTVSHYAIRTLGSAVATAADWEAATPLADVTAGAAGGASVTIPFDAADSLGHVAVVPVDDAGNRARFVSVAVSGTTPAVTGTVSLVVAGDASGAPGENVAAGQFAVVNPSASAVEVGALSLSLSNFSTFDSITVTPAGGSAVTVAATAGVLVFNFATPVAVAPNGNHAFTVSAVLASSTVASTWTFFDTAYAAEDGAPQVAAGGALVLFLCFLAIAFAPLRRGLVALVVLTALVAGCSSDEASFSSTTTRISTVSVSAVSAQTTTGGAVGYTNLPVLLGTVRRVSSS